MGGRRILVTGASGMLGASFVLALRRENDVTGTYADHPVSAPGVRFVRMDLRDTDVVSRTVAAAQPDLVIHAAAMTNLDRAERESARAEAINVVGTAAVAAAADRAGAALVVISTDAVFDGSAGPKDETTEPRPGSVYGRTKLDAERAAIALHPSALVVRTTPVGFGPRGDQLTEWILSRLTDGQEVPGFVDAVFSPIDADSLLAGLLSLRKAGAHGVVHLAGASHVSKYEFAKHVAIAHGFDARRVVESHLCDATFVAPRGADMSLDSSWATHTFGIAIPTVAEVASALAVLHRAGRREEATGMLTPLVPTKGPSR